MALTAVLTCSVGFLTDRSFDGLSGTFCFDDAVESSETVRFCLADELRFIFELALLRCRSIFDLFPLQLLAVLGFVLCSESAVSLTMDMMIGFSAFHLSFPTFGGGASTLLLTYEKIGSPSSSGGYLMRTILPRDFRRFNDGRALMETEVHV
jgi:hypothetical protein